MPALNFMAQFAPLVASGAKRCTIRDRRKHPIRAGDTLYLFTGMRTKTCQRLGIGTCTQARPIEIVASARAVRLGETWLDEPAIADLAQRDGFATVDEFFEFFANEKPRDLIEWALTGG